MRPEWLGQKKGYKYILLPIDKFHKFERTNSMRYKNARTKEDSFENVLNSSKRKPKLSRTNDGKEFVIKIPTNFSRKIIIRRSSRYTLKAAVLAEGFNRTMKKLLDKLVLKKFMQTE